MTRHVLVVGGGVVGLWTALACLDRGFAVTILERGDAHEQGCSFGNAGMLVPSHFVPLAAPGAVRQALVWMADSTAPLHVRPRLSAALFAWALHFARSANTGHVERAAPLLRDLALASRARYVALAQEAQTDIGLVQDGLLIVCATAHALREETATAERARALGLEARVAAGAGARAIEPALREDVAGVVHYPLDCHLVPARLVAHLRARVAGRGGRIVWNAEVTHWRREPGGARVVAARTQDGREFVADDVVVCAGSWSALVARGLGARLLLEGGKGYSVTHPYLPDAPRHGAILAEARVAVTPMEGGLRVGGTMELDGLDLRIDPRRVRSMLEALPRYYANLQPAQFDGLAPWSGLRPCTPDGLPYIGRLRNCPNAIVATGHAMMGVTLAPVTGDIVADLLTGTAPSHDLAPLAPDRFA